MKVTLISPYDAVVAYGVRLLSAVLKAAGVESQMIMLPHGPGADQTSANGSDPYAEPVLAQIADVARSSDLIGVSLASNYLDNAVQITEHLHRSINAPIVWGGVHPTVRPEESLTYADLVCVGEGEEALRELALQIASGNGYAGIRNMWYKRDGQIVRTPLRPLATDLDAYPYPDYDLSTELVLHQGRLQPMTRDLLLRYLRYVSYERVVTYRTLMSRGCHYRCAFCANSALGKLYGKEWRIRRRSVPNFIGELRGIVARFPEIRYIVIDDDHFLDDAEMIREFCSAYQQEVGVPFSLAGVYPAMVDEEKIRLLVDAGMKRASVGIQTGSMRVMHHVYHRPCTLKQITQTFAVLSKFKDRLEPVYQFILDNPWETEQDRLETLRVLLRAPKPCRLGIYSLRVFPGTELYERAESEGLATDEFTKDTRKDFQLLERTYMNSLVELFRVQYVPHRLIALLMSQPLRRLNWVWLPELVGRCGRIFKRLTNRAQRLPREYWSRARNAFSRRKRQSVS
jgi:anaerobic magnesium-protoporphyrin IX monomethyl ester cyclase